MNELALRPTVHPGVFTADGKLYTRNSAPGHSVYGERLVQFEGSEYREWSVTRSKLAAYILERGAAVPHR